MFALGNWPNKFVLGNGRFGVRPAEFNPLGDFDGPLETNPGAGDALTEFAWVINSVPASGTVAANDDGGFSHTGAVDGTYTTVYQLWAWPVGGPISNRGTGNIVTSFGINLVGVGSAQAAFSAAGVITQAHVLLAAGAAQAAASAAGTITQAHLFSGSAAAQAAAAGAGAVTQVHVLQAAAGSQAAVSGTGAFGLGVAITLTAASCGQAASASAGAVQMAHVLTAAPSVQDAVAAASPIVQAHMLAAAAAAQVASSTAGAIVLGTLTFRPPWLLLQTTLPVQTVITTTFTTPWN